MRWHCGARSGSFVVTAMPVDVPATPHTDRLRAACAVVAALCTLLGAGCGNDLGAATKKASFRALQGLPGESIAYAVSADGQTVTGFARDAGVAFRWEATTGMQSIGRLADDEQASGLGVTVDGTVIVGLSGPPNTGEPFIWSARSGMVALKPLPGGPRTGSASGVSSDGTLVAGWTVGSNGAALAVVWNGTAAPTVIGPDGISSYAVAMNPTREVVAGNSITPTSSEPFRWQPGRGVLTLGDVPNGTGHTVANAISTDGRTVCGETLLATGFHTACCWTLDGGWITLPTPLGAESNALGVNLDGSVVVGTADGEAAFWNGSGLHLVADSLRAHGIALPSNWQLWSANGVTPDGQTMVGSGLAPDGLETAWIAIVPASDKSATGG